MEYVSVTMLRAFGAAVVAGMAISGVASVFLPPAQQVRSAVEAPSSTRDDRFQASRLAADVFVTGQISVEDVRHIAASGYRTIVDFRPDGEAPDQAPAAALDAAARVAGVRFVYIPTARSTTPESSVDQLADVVAKADGPLILYCRVGSRASRVWALAEANRSDGASAVEIADAVRNAGHRIDDLLPDIEARIATRTSSRQEKHHARHEPQLR